MTYLDLYIAALYDKVQLGGMQEEVDRVIAEINNPTQAGLDAYLATPMVGPCSVCGNSFPLMDLKPTLDEDVLCHTCKKTP